MMRALCLIPILMLAACAGPRASAAPSATVAPSPPADITATVTQDEPEEGKIPDGITPLTKEQDDVFSNTN